jgi:glycosyltransferase involved in cell wall biosynthesis
VEAFDTRQLLERVIAKASGLDFPLEVQVQGPFETSYGLAIMNRKLAVALNHVPGYALSIFATEGPGDYRAQADDLTEIPDAAALYDRSTSVPYPDVVIRQMWPPRVIDSPGGITCEYFGWEESRAPQSMVDEFNRHLDGIGVMSNFVGEVLRDSGVDVPVRVVGNGVETPDPTATLTVPELERLRKFRFLHISSAFPRKGVDVLLKAYFSEFDGTDDVTLILKTFPNPHNEVGTLLKHLRSNHPNPPDVRWIDRDLRDSELQALYNLASGYVHPARGEGFGLPVAEAMAARVPVISVEYSGLTDFVSSQTALTIPFRIEPARTHLEVPGSTWAEPDQDQLAVQMRRLAENLETPEVQERVTNARHLIATRFSWDAAAARWVSFLQELEEGAETVSVAMATTWNSRCGIAEYASYIIKSAPRLVDFQIFANKGVEILDSAFENGVIRCWSNRWNPDLDELNDALEFSDTDVLHIQFNFGFFELERLAELIDRQLEHRGVVVTFHRTNDIEIQGQMVTLSQIRRTLERVDSLIVHQEADARFLADIGLADNVRLVRQGTASAPVVTSSDVRHAAGLGIRPVLGTFGFLLPHKGILELVRTVGALRSEFPDICLLALCARHPDASSDYETIVRAQIQQLDLEQNVILVTDFLVDETARAILRAADAIVLAYRHTEESSSAALRFILPVERPIIATDLPIFADCRDALLVVDPNDPAALENAIRRVLMDPELQRDLSERAATAARRFRWSRVAADHREIYVAARSAFRRRQARALSPSPMTRWEGQGVWEGQGRRMGGG